MAAAINEHYAPQLRAVVGEPDRASAIVISQTCTAKTLVACAIAKGRGARIVYDCCDPYADYEGMAHGIDAAQRFRDIISIADAITVPTETMRARLTDQAVGVPIVVVPDSIDYQEQVQLRPRAAHKIGRLVWQSRPRQSGVRTLGVEGAEAALELRRDADHRSHQGRGPLGVFRGALGL